MPPPPCSNLCFLKHVTAVSVKKRKKGHESEREKGVVFWGSLKGGNGRGKLCNFFFEIIHYNLKSKSKKQFLKDYKNQNVEANYS